MTAHACHAAPHSSPSPRPLRERSAESQLTSVFAAAEARGRSERGKGASGVAIPGGRDAPHYSPATVGSSEASEVAAILVSGVAGLMVGSFLNVVVYRLPRKMSVVEPPSHCPACGAKLTVVDLVPVLSWLWLRARCRHCGAHISSRYPLIELGTGLLCAAAAGTIGSVLPLPSVAAVLVCALGASLVVADGTAVPWAFAAVSALAAVSLVPVAALAAQPARIGWAALGATLASLAAILSGHPVATRRWRTVALLACLAWCAGWLWPAGGAVVAAWIVAVGALTRFGARKAPFAVLAAGSVLTVLVSAAISRP